MAYRIDCFCANCGWEGEIEFKLGRRISDELMFKKCPICECCSLLKKLGATGIKTEDRKAE